jgi:hypothetical protein
MEQWVCLWDTWAGWWLTADEVRQRRNLIDNREARYEIHGFSGLVRDEGPAGGNGGRESAEPRSASSPINVLSRVPAWCSRVGKRCRKTSRTRRGFRRTPRPCERRTRVRRMRIEGAARNEQTRVQGARVSVRDIVTLQNALAHRRAPSQDKPNEDFIAGAHRASSRPAE